MLFAYFTSSETAFGNHLSDSLWCNLSFVGKLTNGQELRLLLRDDAEPANRYR